MDNITQYITRNVLFPFKIRLHTERKFQITSACETVKPQVKMHTIELFIKIINYISTSRHFLEKTGAFNDTAIISIVTAVHVPTK